MNLALVLPRIVRSPGRDVRRFVGARHYSGAGDREDEKSAVWDGGLACFHRGGPPVSSPPDYADFDEAWVERNALVVRGRAPEGATLRLAARRYKSPPKWAVVEVVCDEAPDAASSGGDGRIEFRLSCSLDGLGATSGICVAGRRHRCLIPVRPDEPPVSP
jgi:hypothetical protein